MLNLSDNYHKAQKEFNGLGIEASRIKLNLSKMMSNKNKSVLTLTKGVEYLFKKNNITYLKGNGSITSQNTVTVVDESKKRSNYQTKNIVISTGSIPVSLPEVKVDEKIIVSSTGALSFSKVPKKLIIIGGGPGGYVCAIRSAQLGFKTACVETRGALGGTCLNVGCIPSCLLYTSDAADE